MCVNKTNLPIPILFFLHLIKLYLTRSHCVTTRNIYCFTTLNCHDTIDFKYNVFCQFMLGIYSGGPRFGICLTLRGETGNPGKSTRLDSEEERS